MRALVLIALAAGCQQPAANGGSTSTTIPGELPRTGATLETVNGLAVTQSMLDAYLAQLPDSVRTKMEAAGGLAQLQEQVVMQEILYQEAIRTKIYEDDLTQTRLRLAERDALVESLLRKAVESRVTDEAVKAWYDDHLVQFRRAQVNASHVLVASEDEAKAVHAEIAGGADFATVAKAKSKDPSAAENGGNLGWFSEREMVKPFAEAAFAGEKGALLEPVESQFGWHVIQVVDKREVVPFEDVVDEITPQVETEVASKYVAELKETALGGGAPAAEAAPAGG